MFLSFAQIYRWRFGHSNGVRMWRSQIADGQFEHYCSRWLYQWFNTVRSKYLHTFYAGKCFAYTFVWTTTKKPSLHIQLVAKLKDIIDSAAKQVSLKYTDEANHVKSCIGLLLRLLAGYFKWAGFTDSKHHVHLVAALASISNGDKSADMTVLAKDTIDVFVKHEPLVIDLATAGHLFHLIEALSHFIKTTNNHQYYGM